MDGTYTALNSMWTDCKGTSVALLRLSIYDPENVGSGGGLLNFEFEPILSHL
jgi:hypothetical protein